MVQAEPMRYLGLPVFYSQFTPKVAHCVEDAESKYNVCGWAKYPELGKLGITTTREQPYREGYTVELMDAVLCIEGRCATNFNELRGSISKRETGYWYIPKGFYLTDIGGKATAVKYGNGPLASTYPIRNVVLLPGETPDGLFVPEDQERLVYSVTCNIADECSYLSRVMTLTELTKYIPKRLSTICDLQLCYDPAGKVIGLNPKAFK
jgi:hypothetical protein